MIRASAAIVVQGPLDARACIVGISTTKTQVEAIKMTSCCNKSTFTLCIAQGEDKTFQLTDAATVDFTGATQITFDVWQNSIAGPSLLSYSLTGGQISLPSENVINFDIPNAESTPLVAGNHYAEVWATTSSGKRIGAQGRFIVQDTRKFDI